MADSKVTEVSFKTDVHLVKILGEQLIGSEKVGILELIKNAYDANATKCTVAIEKIPTLPIVNHYGEDIEKLDGPVITISDNGTGMDKEALIKGWLRPATRIKTTVKERLKTERDAADQKGTRAEYESLIKALKKEHGGRLPLGEKGVGRFATHRLGKYLVLKTKIKNETNEWMLEIDWDVFEAPDENPRDLDEIKLNLINQPPSIDYGPTNSGTMLRIYGGRAGFEWTEAKLYEIGQAIAHLKSPGKHQKPRFSVQFIAPQLSEEIELPTENVPAPFSCVAIVDEKWFGGNRDKFFSPRNSARSYFSICLEREGRPQKIPTRRQTRFLEKHRRSQELSQTSMRSIYGRGKSLD